MSSRAPILPDGLPEAPVLPPACLPVAVLRLLPPPGAGLRRPDKLSFPESSRADLLSRRVGVAARACADMPARDLPPPCAVPPPANPRLVLAAISSRLFAMRSHRATGSLPEASPPVSRDKERLNISGNISAIGCYLLREAAALRCCAISLAFLMLASFNARTRVTGQESMPAMSWPS